MEARNQGEGPRSIRRRRIKGKESFKRWGELLHQPYIMFKILSKLPVHKVAQFRLVCRTWNASFSGPYFTSMLRLKSPETSWFVINFRSANGADVLAAYSCSAKAWFKLPLAFLGRLGARHVALSSSGGLVAFYNEPRRIDNRVSFYNEPIRIGNCHQQNLRIVVFDPLKKSLVCRITMPPNRKESDDQADIPWFLKMLDRYLELSVIVTVGPIALIPSLDSSRNFKLVAFSEGEKSSLWVYNSLGKSWREITANLSGVQNCSLVRGSCAYFLARRYDWFQIVVYNAETDEIIEEKSRVPAEIHRQEVDLRLEAVLFCCRGKLATYSVVPNGKQVHEEYENEADIKSDDEEAEYDKARKYFTLVIWEREFGDIEGEWKEVARMPPELWDDMYSTAYRLRICGSGNLVFLQPEGRNSIVCNVDTGSWEYLPPLPRKIGHKTCQNIFMLDLI